MAVLTLRDLSMQKVISEDIDYSDIPKVLIDDINEYKRNIQRKENLEQLLGSKFLRRYPELKDYKNIKMPIEVFVETVKNDTYYNAKSGYFLAKHDHYYCSKLFGDDYIDKMANMLLDYKMIEDIVIEMLYNFDEYNDIFNIWDANNNDWKEVDNLDNRYDEVNQYKYKLKNVIIHDLYKRSSDLF